MEQSSENLFIEFKDLNKRLIIKPIEKSDSDWIKTNVNLRAGAFHGVFNAEINLTDFITLKNTLEFIYKNYEAETEFEDLEHFIFFKANGNGLGNYLFSFTCRDSSGINASEISFEIEIDQTIIKELIIKTEDIISTFK